MLNNVCKEFSTYAENGSFLQFIIGYDTRLKEWNYPFSPPFVKDTQGQNGEKRFT